jgi:hypothetical protein
MSELQRPPLKIELKLEDGGTTEVRWTYGLSQDLQRVTPDAGAILDVIASDPGARDYLIRRALTPAKKMIKDLDELVDPGDVGLDDSDEVNKLLEWITGHLLYFFILSAGGLKKLGGQFSQQMQALAPPAPSSDGLKS